MTASTTTRAPFVSKAPKLGLVPSFDGMRGMGVCMLLIGHALFGYVESWVTIIDAFFVLSGFLITTLLIQEHRSTKTIDLKKFYQRRAIRLLPSVVLFVGVWLVISTVATLIGYDKLSLRYVGADALAALAYVYHLIFPNGLYIIDPAAQSHRTMWHLWTLSVEEWFYIAIAGTVFVCLKRRWVAQLGLIMGGIFAAIGIARWFAYTGFFQDNEGMIAGVRMIFIQRPDALMLGVAIACLNAHLTQERLERIRKPLIAVGTAGLVVWIVMLNLSSGFIQKLGGPYVDYLPSKPSQFTRPQMLDHMYWFRFGHTIGALAFATVLFCLCRFRTWWPSKFWGLSSLQWMGRLSYTLYIWHALPYLLVFALTGGEDASTAVTFLRVPILVASAFLFAMPVYYFVELRVLKAKLKFSSEKEALDLRTGKMVQVEVTGPKASSELAKAPEPESDGSEAVGSAAPTASVGSSTDDQGMAEHEGTPGGPGAPVV